MLERKSKVGVSSVLLQYDLEDLFHVYLFVFIIAFIMKVSVDGFHSTLLEFMLVVMFGVGLHKEDKVITP